MRLLVFAVGLALLPVLEAGCTTGTITPVLTPAASAHRGLPAGNACPGDTGGGMTGDSACAVALRRPS